MFSRLLRESLRYKGKSGNVLSILIWVVPRKKFVPLQRYLFYFFDVKGGMRIKIRPLLDEFFYIMGHHYKITRGLYLWKKNTVSNMERKPLK